MIPDAENTDPNNTLPPEAEDTKALTVPQPPQTDFNAIINMMANSKDVDADKLEKMLNMQERIIKVNAEAAFSAAMNACQAEMPRVKKNGMIAFEDKNGVERKTPFARLEDIDRAIRPIYQKHGFAVRYNQTKTAEGRPIVICKVSHIGGHTEVSEMELPLDTSGSKNNLQAMGSTISYAKRYLITNNFNIVTEGADDDGNSATPITEEQVNVLKDLITKTSTNENKFLAFMEAESIDKINTKSYAKALNMLKAKLTEPKTATNPAKKESK